MTTGIKSLDDAKSLTAQLERALDEVGVSLARLKVQAVVARLCGARRYTELHYRLESPSESQANLPMAEVRLLTLPELLLLRRVEDDGPVVGHLEFYLKDSSTHWRYVVASTSIRPAALEAARRLVLGEALRRNDTMWLSGGSSRASVIDDEKAADALDIDAQALAGAIYLGEGKWRVGPRYTCQLSANDPLLIEQHGVPVSGSAIADEELAGRQFLPPPDFAEAGFEAFTVNVRSRLMLRCLALQNKPLVLESLRLVGQCCSLESSSTATTPRRLLAALMRKERDDHVRVIGVTGRKDRLLSGMRWEGTRSSGAGGLTVDEGEEEHGSSRAEIDYSGVSGLARIWQEIRDWVAPCESPAIALPGPAAEAPLSAIRRAELAKWMSRGGEREERSDAGAIANHVADGSA
jgi:hypothetical protein